MLLIYCTGLSLSIKVFHEHFHKFFPLCQNLKNRSLYESATGIHMDKSSAVCKSRILTRRFSKIISFGHAVFTCCLHVLSSRAVFACCLHVLFSHAVFTCCLRMLSSRAVFTCCLHVLSSRDIFACLLDVPFRPLRLSSWMSVWPFSNCLYN
jgi:hypothetical protein